MNYKSRAPYLDAAFVRGQQNLTYVDIDLGAGVVDQVVRLPGDILYVDQISNGFAYCEFNSDAAGVFAPVVITAGFVAECDFSTLKINAAAQPGKSMRLVIGNGVRLKSGGAVNPSSSSVSNAEDGSRDTLANRRFCGGEIGIPSGVVQFSQIQLYNSTSTYTRNIRIDSFRVWTTGAGQAIRFDVNPAAISINSTKLGNKNTASGVLGAGQVRYETAGGVSSLARLCTAEIATNEKFELVTSISAPIVLAPGHGLSVAGVAVNTPALSCQIEWTEF